MARTAKTKEEELERQQATDTVETTGGTEPAQPAAGGEPEALEPVQTGDVSQADQEKLLDVPEGLTIRRVGAKNQERIRQLWRSAP